MPKYTKNANGYYTARVWDETYLPNGKKHYVFLRTRKSSKEMERIVEDFKLSLQDGPQLAPITVTEYAEKWLEIYKASSGIKTREMYASIIRKWLKPLRNVYMEDLRHSDVIQILNTAIGHDRISQQILLTLKQIVKAAQKDGYIKKGSYEDLFDDIKVKKAKTIKEKRPLTEEERNKIFDAGTEFTAREKAFIYILYGCGLRRGEALALTRADFDFKNHVVRINKAVTFDKNEPVIKEPKSANGNRIVPLVSEIEDYIRHYVESIHTFLLFANANNKPLSKMQTRTLCKNSMSKINPELTPHTLRHNYCTMLCYQVPIVSTKQIAQLLGDDETMVLKVYKHIIAEKENPTLAIQNALIGTQKMVAQK